MSLSDVEIAHAVSELASRLRGSVGKIVVRPGEPTAIVLEIGRDRLLLSAHPRASRVALEAHKQAAPLPTAFAMLLRKHLSGLRPALAAPPGERLVTLDFGPGRDRLVAELTGPHANVFLLGPDATILGALRPTHSRTRPLGVGAVWTPPPPAAPDARWRGKNRFGEPPGVVDRIAAHYDVLLVEEEARIARERAGAALRRDHERLTRREQALQKDLERIAEAARYRKLGDLLLAHAHDLPGRGATSAVVPDDFEDGAPLTIPLEPALDARENAARYYKQHKRLAAGRKHAEARLAETLGDLAALQTRIESLPRLDLDDLRALAPAAAPRVRAREGGPARLRRASPVAKAKRSPLKDARLPYREFRSATGDLIWVGRTAADNDTLTFRHARGGDVWLHTRDAAGAHVIVPARTGALPPEATLLDAATLAAHYSPLGREAQVDVHVTQVKNLRKPRNAPAGMVYTSDTRTLRVRMDPERVRRLLAGSR